MRSDVTLPVPDVHDASAVTCHSSQSLCLMLFVDFLPPDVVFTSRTFFQSQSCEDLTPDDNLNTSDTISDRTSDSCL